MLTEQLHATTLDAGRADLTSAHVSSAHAAICAQMISVAGPEASYIRGANLTVDGGTNA